MSRFRLSFRTARKPFSDLEEQENPRRDKEPGAGAAEAGGREPSFSVNSGAEAAPKGGDAGNGAAPQPKKAEYDLDKGLSELYGALHDKLASYGLTSIPTFESLYGLFESFLRPSVDEAIAARERKARENMAEIDADAYARGMGGSSYISSMKDRQRASADSDVIRLEGEYSSSMAEYLYKALTAMQQIEGELERTRMTIAAQREAALISAAARSSGGRSSSGSRSSSRSSGSGGSSKDEGPRYGHNKNGAYFDGKWYDGDYSYLSSNATYNQYASYLKGLSPSERYMFFTSDQRTWRLRRWQVQYNLPQTDYEDLYNEYMTEGGLSGSPIYYGPLGGVERWRAIPN